MSKEVGRKSIIIAIILLFVGAGIVPYINADHVNAINTKKVDKTTTLTPGLLAYWNFDEGTGDTVHDSSGNGNDGYIYDCNWVSGHNGTALKFPRLDSIVYGIPDTLDNQITNYIKIEAWVKWYGPGSFLGDYIFDCRCFYGGFLFFVTKQSKLAFDYYVDSQTEPVIQSVSNMPRNTWTHVKAIFDYTSHLMSLYINDKLDNTMTITHPYQDSYDYGAIGNNLWAPYDGEWRPFHGVIDELKIWNIENHPPGAPSITGPASGKPHVANEWNFTATDPDNNDIFYKIDWGDGTITNWLGTYHSGETMQQSHVYKFKGTYTIKSKAKDIYGDESNWSSLKVTMPLSYVPPDPQFFAWLFERFPNAFPILRQLLGY